jgi:uncharacterized protein (TIGR00375 family)
MNIINADLHIHSKYSMATSGRMDIPTLAVESAAKGIHLLGTGDCLHSKWCSEIKTMPEVAEGTYGLNNTRFVLSVEIEDTDRVHHLLILPDISKAQEIREEVEPASVNIDTDGRPNVNLSGIEIAQLAKDADALIGPAHAFTPWTAMYAYHDNLKSCYGDLTPYISFVELGLSADTDMADRISELHRLTFLTNSDAHSPWPNKLAREFNRFRVEDITFSELKKAVLRKGGRGPEMNIGLFPQEGKYHESACIRCFKHYTFSECIIKNWRCKCGGRIKKGVAERVDELSDTSGHPDHRPPYLHIIPLSEIIMMALNTSSIHTKQVKTNWETLIKRFGDEVTVLLDCDLDNIKGVDPRVIEIIRMFREGKVRVEPGGQYGRVKLLSDAKIETAVVRDPGSSKPQRSLFEFNETVS